MWPLLPVLAAGALSLTWWAYRNTRPQPGSALARVLFALRAAALVLLVVAIAGPVVSRLRSRWEPPELLILVEDSASMAIPDAPDAPAGDESESPGAARWSRAWELTAQVDSAVVASGVDLRIRTARGNGLDVLREVASGPERGPDPTARGTDLDRLRRQAREQVASRPVRAVLLFSDGCETEGGSASGRGAQGGLRPSAGLGAVPLVAVGVGDPQGPADRIVKGLRYPATAYQGDEVVVEVAVDHRFLAAPAPPLTVTLLGPNGVEAEITVPVEQDLVPVELTFRPTETGPHAYRLQISPLDNERFLANNEASLAIDVRQERASLLLVTDRPGWDARFLAQAAVRESRLSLTTVYSGPNGLVHADSLTSWRQPVSPEEWLAWDGVVLLGWDGALAGLDWALLNAAVQEGLGLLVIPDGANASSGRPATGPARVLAELLPVAGRNWRWLPGSYSLFSPDGMSVHGILEGLGTTTAASWTPIRRTVRASCWRSGRGPLRHPARFRCWRRSGGATDGWAGSVAGICGSWRSGNRMVSGRRLPRAASRPPGGCCATC